MPNNEYEKLKSASTQPKIVHVVADKAVVSTIVLTKMITSIETADYLVSRLVNLRNPTLLKKQLSMVSKSLDFILSWGKVI